MKFTLTVTDATLDEIKSLLGVGGAVELVVPPSAPAHCTVAVVQPPIAPAPADTGPTPVSVASPPVSAAPTVVAQEPPPADTTSPASAAVFDSAGLPWDERIHSGSKALNADGTWRAKRGLNDPAFKARVEVELRARSAAVPPPLPRVDATPPAPPTVPVPPAEPVAPPPVPVAAPHVWTFESLLNRVVVNKLVGTPQLTEAMALVGATAFGDLALICATDPSKASAVAEKLGLLP